MKKLTSALSFLFIALICLVAFIQTGNAQTTFNINSFTVPPGGQVVLPVKVGQFNNIISIQGTLSFDQTVLQFVQVEQYGLTGMTSGNFGTNQATNGILTYSWNDATLAGVNEADSTVVFAIRFNVIGTGGQQSPLSFINAPASLEVVDVNFNTLSPTYVDGAVIISGGVSTNLKFVIDTVSSANGTQVTLKIRTWNFTNILSIQGTIGFDQSIISYSSVSQFGLSGMTSGSFGVTQVSSGIFTFSWNDASLNGVTISDSSIVFAITFNVIGTSGQSLVQFINAPATLEFVDGNFATLTADLFDGHVTVISSGSANITTSGTTTFCQGDSVTLTANTGAGYLWSPGGQTTQTINATTAGSYTVTVTDPTGFFGMFTSAPVIVSVNNLPATPIISTGGSTTFCQGGTVLLSTSSSGNYLWNTGATTQNISAVDSGNYVLTITDVNGCSASSLPTLITVNALPATPIVSAGGATTFCEGGSVMLTSSSATEYLWSPGGATTQTISALTTSTYTVIVSNANGCSATSNSTDVTVNALPSIPIISSSGPTTFCQGGTDSLFANLSGEYLWNTGATTQNISVSDSGNYVVTFYDVNGCSSTSSPMLVSVNTPPSIIPIITQNGNTLHSSYTNGNQWYNSNNIFMGTGQDFVPLSNGTYYVVYTDGNGCSVSSVNYPFTIIGIFNQESSGFNIFPNPNGGSFYIELNISSIQNLSLKIINSLGQIIYNEDYRQMNGLYKIPVNLGENARGIYFVKLQTANEVITRRVVVE